MTMTLWTRPLAISLLGGAMLAAAGCTDKGSEDPAQVDPARTTPGEPIDTAQDAPLELRLREVGPDRHVPLRVEARANHPLFAEDVGLSAPESVAFSITPPVPGALSVTQSDTLTFTPEGDGFAPNTAYNARIKVAPSAAVAVEGEEGEDAAKAGREGGEWTLDFQTPELALVRAATHRRGAGAEAGRLEIDLVFSAPVSPEEVAKRAKFQVQGRALAPLGVGEGDRPGEVRVRFDIPPEWEEEEVEVTLAAGVPWRGGGSARAGAATARAPVRAGPPVEILSVRLKEGLSGFYIDVICRDSALDEGTERYFWDEDTWDGWWVSERCQLSDAQVAEMVHISPAVDLTVAPAAGGFRLFGDLSRGEYSLEIDAGAQTVDGGVLAQSYEASLRVPARSPQVRFATRGRYLPRSAWDRLAIRHRNLPQVELTVRHIPAHNLAFWLSGEDEAASPRTSDVVAKETITLRNPEDREETSWLDVGQLVPRAGRGVYELSLSGADGQAQAAARLLLTDLQLVAKRGVDAQGVPEAQVWVLGAADSRPVSGVEVKAIRPSGQEIARCETSASGACTLPMPADPLDEQAAAMAIVATHGEDMTYLKFSELGISPEGDVLGAPFRSDSPYRAAVMTERGVYRPGEAVRLLSIVREADHTAPDAGLPVVLKIIDPRNRELRRTTTTTNEAGVVIEDLVLTDFATTGQYRAVLEAGERALGEATFAVEEFVPERMAVTVEGQARGVRTDEQAPVQVSARWLFGGSAADSRVELSCTAEVGPFRPEKNSAYHYGPALLEGEAPRPVPLGVIEGVLDEEGQATLRCPSAQRGGADIPAGMLVARAAVFEGESGRSTVQAASMPLHPADAYLGLRASADSLAAGEQATIDGIAVDWAGEKVASAGGTVTVEFFHLEEEIGWLWDDETGSSTRRRQLRRVRDGQQSFPLQGGALKFPFTPTADAAGYLLVARTDSGAVTELHIPGEGRRYWWDPGQSAVDQTPRPERPTPLDLTLPEEGAVGASVPVRVVAPWPGRLLWTVETDRVVRSEWVEVKAAGEVEWSFPLQEFSPNVYVSALLVKDPHLESREAWVPERGFGAGSVRVRPEGHQHEVRLEVPEEIRPNSPLTVRLQVGQAKGPTYAVVAAVDEGVLQLTDFETPDPTRQLFAQRALGVETFETVGWSLADAGGAGRRTGGDMAGSGMGRVQMVKPVALWSGLVEVGADGRAEVTLDVPGYRGQLRVMAVTVDPSRAGMAEAKVTVRDPLVLQTTLPRFLVAGDLAVVPVSVTNMTGKPQEVTVRLAAEELGGASAEGMAAPVEVEGGGARTVQLAAGESGTVTFPVRTLRAFTAARLTVIASGGGEASTETLDIPLKSARAEERRSQRVALRAGAAPSVDLDTYLTGWAAGSDRSTVWLSANPYGSAFGHLRYLLRYPYGCIEQTTSSTRPLLYTRSLLEATGSGVEGDEVDAMIQSGVERVASMQTPGGGFAYWPGDTTPHLWATAYASHLLLDARAAGVALPAGLVERAVEWMGGEVGGTGDSSGAAYAHYVLARAGKARTADALRRLERLGSDDEESRTLLMAAVQQAGDRRFEASLRAPDLSPVRTDRENSWRFYSDRRRRALTLNLLEELFPGADTNTALADLVADSIDDRESAWYTTQELAWAVSGLGKRVAGLNAALPAPALREGGRTIAAASAGPQGVIWHLGAEDRLDALSLDVPAAAAGGVGGRPLYLHVNTDGVRQAEPEAFGGQGLTLARTWLNGAGEPVTLDEIALGELLYVRVDIRNDTGGRVQNIALVDRIPAGLEIENPRLGRGDLPAWAEAIPLWEREHMNLRDDRLEVFGSLGHGEELSVVYAVRAVTAGEFTQPPASAEAMYDPALWARQPGQRITIVGPWDTAM